MVSRGHVTTKMNGLVSILRAAVKVHLSLSLYLRPQPATLRLLLHHYRYSVPIPQMLSTCQLRNIVVHCVLYYDLRVHNIPMHKWAQGWDVEMQQVASKPVDCAVTKMRQCLYAGVRHRWRKTCSTDLEIFSTEFTTESHFLNHLSSIVRYFIHYFSAFINVVANKTRSLSTAEKARDAGVGAHSLSL